VNSLDTVDATDTLAHKYHKNPKHIKMDLNKKNLILLPMPLHVLSFAISPHRHSLALAMVIDLQPKIKPPGT